MGVGEGARAFAPCVVAEAVELRAPELAAFREEPPQMASGSVGKNGFLNLRFDRRSDLTILADIDHRAPLTAQRALYPDPAMPDQAWLFIIMTSGCVLQGDRLGLEIALAPGASAHVTTQSATKIHSMDANYAAQTQSIALADGAYLELMPEPLIPHRRARFVSDTRITVASSATLLCQEIIQPGRKHHHPDESFGATLLSIATRAERPDGRTLFSEKLLIEPGRRTVRQTGVMGSFDVLGNVILLTPKENADRIDMRIQADVDHETGIAFGASRLPNDAGLIFKALGRETAQVKAKLREFWAVAREEVAGASIPAQFFWR
jgi:urease accessory protein